MQGLDEFDGLGSLFDEQAEPLHFRGPLAANVAAAGLAGRVFEDGDEFDPIPEAYELLAYSLSEDFIPQNDLTDYVFEDVADDEILDEFTFSLVDEIIEQSIIFASVDDGLDGEENDETLEFIFLPLLEDDTILETPVRQFGDDVLRLKRPVVEYKSKEEIRLENALDVLEQLPLMARTSVKRKAAREAKVFVGAISLPSFEAEIGKIADALATAAKIAGEYKKYQQASESAKAMMEDLLFEMGRKREKRRRAQRAIVTWLLH
jgi:hypothetical protein